MHLDRFMPLPQEPALPASAWAAPLLLLATIGAMTFALLFLAGQVESLIALDRFVTHHPRF
jgi:hypothetical protein